MSRLIIISNRLPYSLDTSGENVHIRQSSGGLVSALKGYFEQVVSKHENFKEKIWVGSGEFTEQEWNDNKDILQGTDFTVEPIFIDPELYSDYYNGFCNSTLWPLFHYFPSLTLYKNNEFAAYTKVNQLFADKIVSITEPGDVIWIHDYQLMLLPQMLRKELPKATIGFFLHIPFPTYEVFRLLPGRWKTAILEGLLGADLVGFHTYDYVQYFINSARMIMGLDNHFNTLHYNSRLIKADLFPIGIDYEKFSTIRTNEQVVNYRNELLNSFGNKKIIFSVDRLDYTKGLTYRLDGIDNFLERYPDWKENVIFILNIVPSRDTIPAYFERKRMIEEKVSMINGKYSSIQWQPIIYRYNHLLFEELCALYLAANVALITPLRDGMNLVAKEYVAGCQDEGVLILSELTGAASELNEAYLVNPTDTEDIADHIAAALTMPAEEQKQRLQIMQKRLSEYNVVQWVNDFLEQLLKVKKEQKKQHVKLLNEKAIEAILSRYRAAQKKCIFLDYDGTLEPLTRMPSQATPSGRLLTLLEEISRDETNDIFIISGRDAATLDKWLGHLPLNFIAEHGAMIKYKHAEWEAQSTVPTTWKDEIRPMLQSYVFRCAGSFLEEKKFALTWHYRNTHPDLGFIRSRELLNNLVQLTANSPLQVIDGNKVIELRLTGMDKGMTALKVINLLKPDFILCLGDDTTDEDMFKVLEEKGFTIKIGSGNTAARYNLPQQKNVLAFLERFTSIIYSTATK